MKSFRKAIIGVCVGAVVALGATPATAAPPTTKQLEICAKHLDAKEGTGPRFCREEGGGLPV